MDTDVSPPVGHSVPLAITVHPADASASARAWAAAGAVQLLTPTACLVLAVVVVLGVVPASGALVAAVVAALGGWVAWWALCEAAWRYLDDAVDEVPSDRVRVADRTQRPLSPRMESACLVVLLGAAVVLVGAAL